MKPIQIDTYRWPCCRYYRWRELIAVLSSLVTLIHGVLVLCPGFVPALPPGRLTNPLLFVRLIGGEMQLFLGAFNRVRHEYAFAQPSSQMQSSRCRRAFGLRAGRSSTSHLPMAAKPRPRPESAASCCDSRRLAVYVCVLTESRWKARHCGC